MGGYVRYALEEEETRAVAEGLLRQVNATFKETGLSASEIGALVNKSRNTIGRYTKGETVPDAVTLLLIARLADDPREFMAKLAEAVG